MHGRQSGCILAVPARRQAAAVAGFTSLTAPQGVESMLLDTRPTLNYQLGRDLAVWTGAVEAALRGGASAKGAITAADEVLEVFQRKFSKRLQQDTIDMEARFAQDDLISALEPPARLRGVPDPEDT